MDTTLLFTYALPALVAGIGIGWFLFRGASKFEELSLERDTALARAEQASSEVARLERELASTRDQVKPLADEVDKLKKEKAARKAEASPEPAGEPGNVSLAVGWKPGRKLPTFLDAPIGPTDDLSMLKGVGPRLAARLREIGIFYFAQIADWSPEEVKLVDAKLDSFRGRIEKDQLIEQAKLLAAGRITEYEARFGKLGSN